MTYSTIYDMRTAHAIADGVQSQKVCDATINTAREIATTRGRSVIVEDWGTHECYRVTPAGHRWRVPMDWIVPDWTKDNDE